MDLKGGGNASHHSGDEFLPGCDLVGDNPIGERRTESDPTLPDPQELNGGVIGS